MINMAMCEHDWIFSTPCPQCTAAVEPQPPTKHAEITPVTPPPCSNAVATGATGHSDPVATVSCPEPGGDGSNITAAVTLDDGLDIPPFLQRAPDNTWKFAELHPTVMVRPLVTGPETPRLPENPLDSLAAVAHMERVAPPPMFPEGWQDLPLLERQPYMRKMHAMEDQAKARARIAKIKGDEQ